MARHHAMRPNLDQAHDQIGVVDCHMLVVGLRFATAQEVRQIDRQKTHAGQPFSQFFCKELGHVDLLAMTIGVRRADFRHRNAQVGSLREHDG